MNGLTCPECGEELEIGQDWRLIDKSKLGTKVKGGESIQGDYAHRSCLE